MYVSKTSFPSNLLPLESEAAIHFLNVSVLSRFNFTMYIMYTLYYSKQIRNNITFTFYKALYMPMYVNTGMKIRFIHCHFKIMLQAKY